jgi:hypothetical protein
MVYLSELRRVAPGVRDQEGLMTYLPKKLIHNVNDKTIGDR